MSFEVVFGKKENVSTITEIFNHYILNSNARFETEPFTIENRMHWYSQFSVHTPHVLLVAKEDDKILGFCCSQPYRPSGAFVDTVEVTIYLAPDATTKGIGTALYRSLFAHLKTQNVHSVLSGVAMPNDASLALHKKFGFREVGTFSQYAKKHDEYISSTWLQLLLSEQQG
ncbi:GNAT family N-acetyltransferase [Veronia nyctiphanis]|uniref:GNAT family N-acetyltransferase n=1 Tax=Veronia nyctiphanis TaxID=1278244 RepID=A0A4Q0YTR6_9GAMM|nr:GNAT family N-acetyltransferase [Veronia nyctiphanis]RXJ74647.1 GNAT family N-acetyltransferase [Veronia nyctiphanis]